jgi:hypothetical protein
MLLRFAGSSFGVAEPAPAAVKTVANPPVDLAAPAPALAAPLVAGTSLAAPKTAGEALPAPVNPAPATLDRLVPPAP